MLYTADNELSLADAYQCTLLERTIGLLSPIKKATENVSAKASSAGDIIPLVISIKHAIDMIGNGAGIQKMNKLIDSINSRFSGVTQEPLNAVVTLVDPRYRRKLFATADLATAMQWLIDKAELVVPPLSLITHHEHPVDADSAAQPWSPKWPRVDDPLDLLKADLQAVVDRDPVRRWLLRRWLLFYASQA